jgi:hypothetical protein
MEIFYTGNKFGISYYDMFNIWYYKLEMEKKGYKDINLLVLGYVAITKNKYHNWGVECMQAIRTFKKIGNLPIKKFDIVTCGRNWAKILNHQDNLVRIK